MASSPFVAAAAVLFLLATTTTASSSSSSSSSPPPKDMCSRTSVSFMDRLHRRCPPPPRSLPLQMDGETFERILSSTSKNVRIAVLFYDPDSPFSTTARIDFDMLSFMFPHVSHIAIEKSSAMPSLFSRYNIHSLPALFIVHQTGQRRYYGHKDLHSMMQFYKRTLEGHDPVEYHAYDKSGDQVNDQMELQPWYLLTWREMLEKEPFLVLATMFLVMRASLYLYSRIWSQVVGVWNWCKQQFNFGMFEESRQLLGQVVNLVDVKRVWCKLKLCKTREFENGARSARIWASSLASVSLGETCCGRPSSSLES